ncbi:uncharacterized protein LOC120136440 [Hibiscus syriacus]|uniref:uncharacterized protein LOC120136440 n=1 Tax=Hibiscus syriacus TaxID=106335 RepID=UPI001921DAFA|nr:uncharacterized protein LOC120136440 [Hibiscus syriacus]
MRDFQETLTDLDLFYHPFLEPTYTWSNKQQSTFLARKLDRVLVNPQWVSSFKDSHVEFQAPGTSDHCLAQVWLSKEAQILFSKLKRLKFSLKNLNHICFSDLPARVKQKKTELEQQQLKTLKGEEDIKNEISLQNELKNLEEAETLFFRQKTKIQWLKEGDKCTRLFHSAVVFKNKRDTIRTLIDENGNWLETYDQMSAEVVKFFSNLIGTVDPTVKEISTNQLKDLIQFSFSVDKAEALVKNITKEEIKDAFFSQGNEKAPGLDGYSPHFFKSTWPIIERDVVAAISYFFTDSYLCPAFNATVIALVPKIPKPSKLISTKLFVNWITTCFSTASYSISVNGSLYGYIKGAKGLRQGDPISPLLFILSMNILSRLFNLDALRGVFGYHPKYKNIGLKHLSFADDLLIFCKGNEESVISVTAVLDYFYDISGVKLNTSKSEFLLLV